MDKKIALITGGSRGIGRACAITLARLGMHVGINYARNAEAAQEALSAVLAAGGSGELCSFDLADTAVNRYPDQTIEARNPMIEGDGKLKLKGLEADGSKVTFTPTSSGTTTIKVTVSDASGDPTRHITARINVTVTDVPDAPSQPILSSVEASSAVLSWPEPNANGAPITRYKVRGSHGYEQT